MKQANLHSESVPLKVEVIDEFDRPMRIRDTSLAQTLLAERAKLLSRVRSLRPEI